MGTVKKIQAVVVCGLIINEKKEVLLALRYQPDLPDAHLKWELPGGQIEFGETMEDALVREMKEEVGVEIEVAEFIPYVWRSGIWKFPEVHVQSFIMTYFCRLKKGEIVGQTQNHEQEIADLQWFNPQEIPWDQCLPGLREIFQAANLLT